MIPGIYLSVDNNEDGFRIPINPEEVNVDTGSDGEVYTISRLGKVNVPNGVELSEYRLESFFPLYESHLAVTKHKEPSFYIDRLKKWQREDKHVRYIYTDGSFTINELVTIESFNYRESDASGDVYYTLEFKKYVPFEPKKMVVVKTAATEKKKVVKKKTPPRENKKPKPVTYALKKGDSLWKVAQKYTGKGSNYPELAKLNNIKKSDYTRLPIGLKIKIPTDWTK